MFHLDHFVYGVPNLLTAIEEFSVLTGVRPELGGGHPKLGTHNALVSLGGSYFELVANDFSLQVPTENRLQALSDLKKPRLFSWMLQYDDLNEAKDRTKKFGIDLSEPLYGSRITPSGTVLRYEYVSIIGLEHLGEAIPYLIRWLPGSQHPANTSPKGCVLEKFRVFSPLSKVFSEWILSLGLSIECLESAQPTLEIGFSSPSGVLMLR